MHECVRLFEAGVGSFPFSPIELHPVATVQISRTAMGLVAV